MADEVLKRDSNRIVVLVGITDDSNEYITMLRVDPTTKRLKVSATISGSGLTVGTTTITGGTTTRILYDNAGVLGEYTISGSGTTVAMATAPTFGTSITGSYLTASEILITDGSKNIVSAPVSTYPSLTELTYLKGVTSAIQTQLNTKGTGTVTSVAMTVPTGLTISGSPVTTSGTLAVALDTGYVIPLQTTLDGYAVKALSNLASVAINTSLISDTDSTDDLGSASIAWANLYIDTIRSATSQPISIIPNNNIITLGGGTTATELRFLEPSASGTNYTAFKAQAQSADITYTLPATVGAAGTVLTDAAGNGTFSWATAGGGGGLNFVAADLTERTTTSTSAVDLVTITSLSLTAGTRVRVVGKARKTSGAAAAATLGLKINATVVREPSVANNSGNLWVGTAVDQAEDGSFWFEFEVGETNYQTNIQGAGFGRVSSTGADTGATTATQALTTLTAPLPAATVTDIIIRGICGSASVTLAVVDVRVYTYANS